ncbi:hypothetical protein NEOLEDRAFT_1053882 [Neolentinus lepideus HHB14362 ss-1]|uniref:Homeobox domain-containing protein n=1 Tax=Neolentinus lepideus HHB14362 ss-1 TaxID=1314782 RepID=A0A165W8I8_9AGAM|nr:hypothetical protein NEOLEDRAFT_1053882 [Neolentinus lepideus HHB14362 ss-1]
MRAKSSITLRSIYNVSQQIKAKSISRLPHRVSQLATRRRTNLEVPSFTLPPVESVSQVLIDAGASAELAVRVSVVLEQQVTQLRQSVLDGLRRTWTRLSALDHEDRPDSLMNRTVEIQTRMYNLQVKTWMDRAVDQCQRLTVSAGAKSHTQTRRLVFNQEYIPVLEYMFAHNRFPSQADKTFLAKKSGMSYKQIHVWVRILSASNHSRCLQ